ncbi:MAG: hypothetical protein FWG08_04990 [Propionibacteriaceae bacterium]|nr:hypothetical protein [Propionibacteriaceae bacterium]
MTAYNADGVASASKTFNVSVNNIAPIEKTVSKPLAPTMSSATVSPTSGSNNMAYKYTVATNAETTKLKFMFNGDSTAYWVYSDKTMSPAKWGGVATVMMTTSGTTRTWTVSNGRLAAGNRTVTVTAYNANGVASTSKTFTVPVYDVATVPQIKSVSSSPATGTAETPFTYSVTTSTNVAKLKFTRTGTSTEYWVYENKTLTPSRWGGPTTGAGSATAQVSDKNGVRTWTITNHLLPAGDHTITVTAYSVANTPVPPPTQSKNFNRKVNEKQLGKILIGSDECGVEEAWRVDVGLYERDGSGHLGTSFDFESYEACSAKELELRKGPHLQEDLDLTPSKTQEYRVSSCRRVC